MSASQRFLRGFRAFRCRIDTFVYRRFQPVRKGVLRKGVLRKGVNLLLRVVWIVPGLKISRRGYRNDAPYIAVDIIVFNFDDAVGLRVRLSRPLQCRGVRVIENGFVDLCVPCLHNNVTYSFAVRRVRDPKTACRAFVLIPHKVSDVCPGLVFPCRTVGVFKPCLVEDIAPATVCRQMNQCREVVQERRIPTVVSEPNIAYFQRGFLAGGFAGDPVIEVNCCRLDFGLELLRETGCYLYSRSLTGYHPLRPFSAAVLGLCIYGRGFVRPSRILDPVVPVRLKGNVVVVAWELNFNSVLCFQYRNEVCEGRN